MVPLRNEAANATALIKNLKQLSYWNLEILLLDDGSEDETYTLLQDAIGRDQRFTLIKGKPKPPGWMGKSYACHQLSQLANGKYYLFIDADIRLNRDTIQYVIHHLSKKKAGQLTGFPKCPTPVFLSRLLVPMQHFVVLFHLPIWFANHTTFPAFTAAHGAFMAFERNSYHTVGGHTAAHDALVEDMTLTRAMKSHGHRVLLMNIASEVTCYMYSRNIDVWNGFLKNTFPGIGRSYILAVLISFVYLTLYVFPLFILGLTLFEMGTIQLALMALLFIWLQRAFVDWLMGQKNFNFLLMPLSAAAMVSILIASMYNAWRRKGYIWKGRQYS
ncbi:glycosyltransferase [Bacillaceae bacterium SIJ1]|nr:glycosyltransferase [Litoribacterium kuwaitense]